jgi:glycosyltransferase involved in cell wall biosynthesis
MSVHNGEEFLAPAIDSILKQTYSNFEFLIVDDASNDNTLGLLEAIDDPRLRLITLNKNLGLADALNIASANASGDLIARMDADDISEPDRFNLQVDFLSKHPEVGLLGTACSLIDSAGLIIGSQTVLTDNDEIQERLLYDNQFCHPSVMIRSILLKNVGGYRNIGGRFAQDYDLWLRISEKSKMMNLEQRLLRYRIHDNQVSISKLEAQARTAELYRILAMQRRLDGAEDLSAAESLLKKKSVEIRSRVAANLLDLSKKFHRRKLFAMSRSLHWRAIRTAPFSRAVLESIWTSISIRLRKQGRLN